MNKNELYKIVGRVPGGVWVERYAQNIEQAANVAKEVETVPGVMFVDVWGPSETWGRPYVNMRTQTYRNR